MKDFVISQEMFSGPLHLLLELIEKKQLPITDIALAQVTDDYLKIVETGTTPPEELGDFLVIAAKLLWLKSKALLPDLSDFEEEGPSLSSQLRMYQIFVQASEWINTLYENTSVSFSRQALPTASLPEGFCAPIGLTTQMMLESFEQILRRLNPWFSLQSASLDRVISIEERIHELRMLVQERSTASFHALMFARSQVASRQEIVVSFLAILELARQQVIELSQKVVFEDILIKRIESISS